jgi:hypothetical protein
VKRPLYVVGAGGLGTRAVELDNVLESIFDMATITVGPTEVWSFKSVRADVTVACDVTTGPIGIEFFNSVRADVT